MVPVEYYLGVAVAIILLVLLISAVTGKSKRTTRRVAVRENNPSANDELTRQVARAADALEALLVQLKASGVLPTLPVQQAVVHQPSSVTSEVPTQPAAPLQAQGVAERPSTESLTATPTASEPSATETSAQTGEQKPRHIKLSMFGR